MHQRRALPCSYAPGAGDDEETWAEGLTAPRFWAAWQDLLVPGAHGLSERIRAAMRSEVTGANDGAVCMTAGQHEQPDACGRTPSGRSAGAASRCRNLDGQRGGGSYVGALAQQHTTLAAVATDEHHPAPMGCAAGGEADVQQLWPGAYVVCAGVVIASESSAAAQRGGVWSHVGVVIDMCSRRLPHLCRRGPDNGRRDASHASGASHRDDAAVATVAPASPVCAWQRACSYSCCWAHSAQTHEAASKAHEAHLCAASSSGGAPCNSEQRTNGGPECSPSERTGEILRAGAQHLHVPIAGSKVERGALERALHPIVCCLHESLQMGRHVLLVDTHGVYRFEMVA